MLQKVTVKNQHILTGRADFLVTLLSLFKKMILKNYYNHVKSSILHLLQNFVTIFQHFYCTYGVSKSQQTIKIVLMPLATQNFQL